MELQNQIRETLGFLRNAIPEPCPKIAVVLGSGLRALVDALDERFVVEVSEIPHWPVPSVRGHEGRLVFGKIGKIPTFVLQGRVHFYEGFSIQEVVFPIRVLGKMDVKSLVLTNAAGGLNPDFTPGDLMIITDHINFMFQNPLIGIRDSSLGVRFPDMSQPYDREYIALAETVGRDLDVPLRKGVLMATPGPSYETAAEIRMMRQLGADAVCMSTIPEVIAGVQMGLRMLGVSCITNLATGLSERELSHDEVEITARRVEEGFVAFIKEIVVRISEKRKMVR